MYAKTQIILIFLWRMIFNCNQQYHFISVYQTLSMKVIPILLVQTISMVITTSKYLMILNNKKKRSDCQQQMKNTEMSILTPASTT